MLFRSISDAKNAVPFDSVSLSNSPGAISAKLIPIAKSMGIQWIASGPLVSTADYKTMICEGVYLVPFSLAESSASFKNDFVVFDETLPNPEKARRLLEDFLKDPLFAKNSVMEELAVLKSTEVSKDAAASLSGPWTGDYSIWISDKNQTGFLSAL